MLWRKKPAASWKRHDGQMKSGALKLRHSAERSRLANVLKKSNGEPNGDRLSVVVQRKRKR